MWIILVKSILYNHWRLSVSAAAQKNFHKNHSLRKLALTLFMLRILANYSDTTFSLDDFAFLANGFYRWSYFHWKSSFRKFIKICSFLSAQIQYTHAFGLYIITAKYKMQAFFWIKSHFFIFSPNHPFILPTANAQRRKIIHFMCICRHLRYS